MADEITFPINVGVKEDHPARVLKLATVDPKYYYTAEELKLYEAAINALHNLLKYAKTSDFINNGSNGLSRYVELSEIGSLIPTTVSDTDTALFDGDAIWQDGLNYYAYVRHFKIDGVEEHLFLNTNITIDPLGTENPTYKKRVVFIVEADGLGGYILKIVESDPAENPLKPTLDASYQLEITEVTISAGASEPDNVSRKFIYAEGDAEEWNVTTSNATTVKINSLNNPPSGLKSILCENVTQDTTLSFKAPVAIFTSSESILVFDLKLESVWEWKSSERITIDIYLKSNDSRFAGRVRIGSDFGFNFDGSNISDTQKVIVRLSRLPGIYDKNTFDEIEFVFKRTQNEIFRIDNVALVEGVENNNIQAIPRKVSELFNDLLFQTKDEVQAKNATVHKSTATINTLIADQSTHLVNELIEVIDASDDNLVNSGTAIYKYKGTTNGNLTDYQLQYKQESLITNLKTLSDVWNIGGMNVRAYATNYPILVNIHTALPKNLPIDELSASDITNGYSRKDAIVATTSGDIIVIKGTPALTAFIPFIDTDLYYFIRDVLIIPGATEPVDPATGTPNTTDLVLFAETGTEAGGESTVTASSATVTIATDSGISGTKCIRGLNVPRTGIFSKFAFATAKDFANFTALNFDFKLDTAITSLYFTINIYNGTQLVGSKNIFSNQNGFLNSITSVQNINIPKEEFNITGTAYTYIEIRPRSYSSAVANLNYRIDNVKLIDGFTTNPNNPVQTTHTHSNLSVLEQITQEMINAIGTIATKQNTLVSGVNIKTVNGNNLLGSGNIEISSGSFPAPFLEELIPDSNLPSTTGNFILKGAYFKEEMCLTANLNNTNGILIEGQTINYATFVSDNQINVNITTGAAEGEFDVTLNNGILKVFPNQLLIVLGTVFKPTESDWIDKIGSGDFDTPGEIKLTIYNALVSGVWDKVLNYNIDFRVYFKVVKSPTGNYSTVSNIPNIAIVNSLNNELIVGLNLYSTGPSSYLKTYSLADGGAWVVNAGDTGDNVFLYDLEFRFLSGVLYLYKNKVLRKTFNDVLNYDTKLKFDIRGFDIIDIKYIELAT
ncbi:hypothetical protein [Lutibacter sp.]|uniref:hypothetical protein n=1 Tax=Lutibacter sp. TaxID=1925666 RepID=UPI003566A6CC